MLDAVAVLFLSVLSYVRSSLGQRSTQVALLASGLALSVAKTTFEAEECERPGDCSTHDRDAGQTEPSRMAAAAA